MGAELQSALHHKTFYDCKNTSFLNIQTKKIKKKTGKTKMLATGRTIIEIKTSSKSTREASG